LHVVIKVIDGIHIYSLFVRIGVRIDVRAGESFDVVVEDDEC